MKRAVLVLLWLVAFVPSGIRAITFHSVMTDLSTPVTLKVNLGGDPSLQFEVTDVFSYAPKDNPRPPADLFVV